MDTVDLPRFIFSFLLVLGLIGLMAFFLKRYGNRTHNFLGQKIFGMQDQGGRIKILEVRYIDPKRRLMLIRRDRTEHLLLLADGRELVIESGIENTMMDASSPADPHE